MDRNEIIEALREIAIWLEIKGENSFKIRAYTNASRSLQRIDEEQFEELVRTGALGQKQGFGEALVSKITEMFETGHLVYLENLRAEFPESLRDVLTIPGVGPKKVKQYYEQLRITSVDELEAACDDGRIAELPGSGPKTAGKIKQAIERQRQHSGLFLYFEAKLMAAVIVEQLRALPATARVELAGSVRRGKEVTKDIDLVAASAVPREVMEAFVKLPQIGQVDSRGQTKCTAHLQDGPQVDLRVVTPEHFATAWHHFTGSKEHNVKMRSRALKRGLHLSEWGLFREDGSRLPIQREEDLFRALELAYIPPELREDLGEIERAEQSNLPRLVDLSDYGGVLHCHSTASDGADSVEKLVAHARGLGHRFLGITDHSRSQAQANGLGPERLLWQVDELRKLQKELPRGFRLFAGVECDILSDGTLDYPDEVLAKLDYAVISVHSAMNQPRDQITARIVKAIEHPASRILAHPSCRLLLHRLPCPLDYERIFAAAVKHRVALEFNCHPRRLDMDWRLWHRARELGVLCSLNPDAHSREGFSYLHQGMDFVRKGWLGPEHIINCWPLPELEAFFAHGR